MKRSKRVEERQNKRTRHEFKRTVEYPCQVCDKSCELNVVICTECSQWTHFKCLKLKKDIIKKVSSSDVDFYCTKCSFTEAGYNFNKALTRLRTSDNVESAAASEELLLQVHNITVPQLQPVTTDSADDVIAIQILKKYSPIVLDENVPKAVMGDGNCLFRALSLAFFNSEQHHSLLRLLSCIEVILNRLYYDNNSSTFLINDINVVTSPYEQFINSLCTLGSYSDMLAMYALSAATGEPFQSFYPPVGIGNTISGSFTRKIVGRGVRASKQVLANIMWSKSTIPTSNIYIPNHFCVLVSNMQDPETIDISDETLDVDKSNTTGSIDVVSDIINVSDVKSCSLPNNVTSDDSCNSVNSDDSSNAFYLDVNQNNVVIPNGNLPGNKFMLPQETVKALLNKDSPHFENIPDGSKENVYFIIDNSANISKKQSECKTKASYFRDDCGAWKASSTSSHKCYYVVENGNWRSVLYSDKQYCLDKRRQGKQVKMPLEPQPSESSILVLTRYYSNLKKDPSYKRRITWLERLPHCVSEDSSVLTCALVEYAGKYPGLDKHGNATNVIHNYKRSKPETFVNIDQELLKNPSTKDVYTKLHTDSETVLCPRDEKQVQNRKYKKCDQESVSAGPRKNSADHIQSVMNMLGTHPMVQQVGQLKDKSPYVILYTEHMIKDMLVQLQNHPNTVIGIDKTYNLGQVFVSTTVYKNCTVNRTKTQQHPIFFGPMLLHSSSNYMSFHCFFSHLSAKFSKLNKILLGSDDEEAMVNALTDAFRGIGVHMLCTQHLETNTTDYLTNKVGVDVVHRKSICEEIFGDNGIASSTDLLLFEARVTVFKTKWATYEKFINYCENRLFPLIEHKVCGPVWEHNAPPHWNNNNAESGNHVLKQATKWKLHQLPELIQVLFDVVKLQQMELERAMIGMGNFILAPNYVHYFVEPHVWASMTDSQRKRRLGQFISNRKPDNTKTVTSTDGQLTVPIKQNAGKKPHQRKRLVAERAHKRPR